VVVLVLAGPVPVLEKYLLDATSTPVERIFSQSAWLIMCAHRVRPHDRSDAGN